MSIKSKIQSLIAAANAKTGESDATLTDAVQTLCGGYGQGGDPNENLNKILTNTLTYFKTDLDTDILPWYRSNNYGSFNSLIFCSMRNFSKTAPFSTSANGIFNNMTSLKYCCLNFQGATGIGQNSFATTRNLKTLIIRKSSGVLAIGGTNNFTNSGILSTGYVYVPDLDDTDADLPAQYKAATNWSAYADRIRGYSEAPAYHSATVYAIGDVCRYSGKLYGYCKADLASSAGNAPSGTTADNDYWEYVDDIREATA